MEVRFISAGLSPDSSTSRKTVDAGYEGHPYHQGKMWMQQWGMEWGTEEDAAVHTVAFPI